MTFYSIHTVVKIQTSNGFVQCVHTGGRHLTGMNCKTMWNKTLNMYFNYETERKPPELHNLFYCTLKKVNHF